jgi:hypothetical protein
LRLFVEDLGTETRLSAQSSRLAGMTNRKIGERLLRSEDTASVHVSRNFVKLDVRGRVEAATMAQRRSRPAAALLITNAGGGWSDGSNRAAANSAEFSAVR